MIVKCKVNQCPYYNKQGFCVKKEVLMIDELGMCSVIWRKGQKRVLQTPFTDTLYPKEQLTILNVVKNDQDSRKENAEGSLKDLPNGATASQEISNNEQKIEKKNVEKSNVQKNDENENKVGSK